MPNVWPGAKATKSIVNALDLMSSHGPFMDLVKALLLVHRLWLSDSFKAHFKDHELPCFGAAVAFAKRLLHVTYNLATGFIMKSKIADGLNGALGLDETFDFYARGRNGISLDQVLLVSDFELQAKRAFDDGPALAAYEAHISEGPEASFYDTTAFHVDAFGRLLRTAVCATASLQRVHLDILKHQKSMPKMKPDFRRTMGPAKSAKGVTAKIAKAARIEEIWRNYLFDIAASWMLLARLHEAITTDEPKKLIHALHKARMWSLTTGLAGSAANLKTLEPANGALNQSIGLIESVGLVLHSVYLQLWAHGLPVLNAKASSELAVKRSIGRISASVFVRSTETKTDMPDCGTGTIQDNHWTLTMLTDAGIGIANGPHGLIGTKAEDLNTSVFAGCISAAITKSTAHLWAAVVSLQVWLGQLDEGLPAYEAIKDSVGLFLKNNNWTLSLGDLDGLGQDFRKAFTKNRAQDANDEIDSILQKM